MLDRTTNTGIFKRLCKTVCQNESGLVNTMKRHAWIAGLTQTQHQWPAIGVDGTCKVIQYTRNPSPKPYPNPSLTPSLAPYLVVVSN